MNTDQFAILVFALFVCILSIVQNDDEASRKLWRLQEYSEESSKRQVEFTRGFRRIMVPVSIGLLAWNLYQFLFIVWS
jgi:hypothetical protein